MIAGLKGIFLVFPKRLEVERGVVGIFCRVGPEAI
jgi:hypothetical protein